MTDTQADHLKKFQMLPFFYGRVTSEKVEREVERITDHADAVLMRGDATQQAYDEYMGYLSEWADKWELVARGVYREIHHADGQPNQYWQQTGSLGAVRVHPDEGEQWLSHTARAVKWSRSVPIPVRLGEFPRLLA